MYRPPKDYPIAEIAQMINKYRAELGSFDFYQKFTCDHCDQRLSMSEPNVLYESGTCDRCGKTTNIAAKGCGFMLRMTT